jgi:hypothetical protein
VVLLRPLPLALHYCCSHGRVHLATKDSGLAKGVHACHYSLFAPDDDDVEEALLPSHCYLCWPRRIRRASQYLVDKTEALQCCWKSWRIAILPRLPLVAHTLRCHIPRSRRSKMDTICSQADHQSLRRWACHILRLQ